MEGRTGRLTTLNTLYKCSAITSMSICDYLDASVSIKISATIIIIMPWFLLVDIVCAVFEAHGFQDLGKEDFNPHLTIAKMSRAQRGSGGRGWRRRRRQEKSLNGISEELYVEFKDREFGIEKVGNTVKEVLSFTLSLRFFFVSCPLSFFRLQESSYYP